MRMFCPRCGQEQNKRGIRFCTSCGFVVDGLENMVRNGGLGPAPPNTEDLVSPKMQGLKQGGIMFLSGIIVVPLLAILTEIFGGEGYVVGISALLLFLGGIIRMIYALIFQPGKPTSAENAGLVNSLKETFLGAKKASPALPPAEIHNHHDFSGQMGNWRDTSELEKVPKGVDRSTKVL